MATMTEIPEAASTVERSHDYHAEAHVLSGHLQRPIEQKIEEHAPVKLKRPERRSPYPLCRRSQHRGIDYLRQGPHPGVRSPKPET